MNRERQRKLEARARRQESLANAYSSFEQAPVPSVIESKHSGQTKNIGTQDESAIATEEKKTKNIVAIAETKSERKRAPKLNKSLQDKKTVKAKERK